MAKKDESNKSIRITKKVKKELLASLVKTFDDALQVTGKSLPSMEGLPKDVVAFAKLTIIAEALNSSELAEDGGGKYYPCFRSEIHTTEKDYLHEIEGTTYILKKEYETIVGITPMRRGHIELSKKSMTLPLSLCVSTPLLALYFAEQFIDIWSDYLGYTGVTTEHVSLSSSEKK